MALTSSFERLEKFAGLVLLVVESVEDMLVGLSEVCGFVMELFEKWMEVGWRLENQGRGCTYGMESVCFYKGPLWRRDVFGPRLQRVI